MTATLRSFMLAIPLALALAGAAGAQDQPAPDAAAATEQADPSHQLARLTQRLQLSPAQAAQIGPILQDRLRQTRAVRDDSSLAGPDRRARLQEIVQRHNSQIEAILNDGQRQQFIQMQQQRAQRMAQRRDQMPASDGH